MTTAQLRLTLRRRVPAVVLAAGAAVILLGSLSSWVAGPAAAGLVYGSVELDSVPALGSRAGLAGGDGLLTLIAGGVAGLCGLAAMGGYSAPVQRVVAFCAGGLCLAWAMLDAAEIGDVPGLDGRALDLDAGAGVFAVAIGAGLVLAASAVLRVDHARALRRRARLVDRLVARNDLARATDQQQRLVRGCIRHLGWQDVRTIDEVVYLARMYAACGHPDRAASVLGACRRQAAAHHPDNAELLAEVHELAAHVGAG